MTVLLEARGLGKTFRETTVLRDAGIILTAGRVRGLLGQNGSGKSTLIKLLAGFHAPDPGAELVVRGEPVSLPVRPEALASLGIGFMHQDLGLEESMTIVENLVIDGSASVAPARWGRRRQEVRRALADFGLHVDVDEPVSTLTAGQRAVLALARAVRRVGDGGVLVLDEPTASLDRDGVELLLTAVERLRARGCAVLFVGHNLDEALRLCDDVTVLRDGVVVADRPASSFDEDSLINTIVGRDIGEIYPDVQTRPGDEVVLDVQDLTGQVARSVSFQLHRGEIVGLTGLAGMGHDEVPELVFGHHRPRSGSVALAGRPLSSDPSGCLRAGVVLISGDRKRVGVHATATVADNVVLPVARRFFRSGRLRHRSIREEVQRMLVDFDVRPPSPDAEMGQLSGGNQQKAVVGKWLSVYGDAKVLLLAEPVHGVDVAARQAIFRHVRAAADRGMAVLYVSSEHDDLAHLCDRVLVLRDGRVRQELSGSRLTEQDLTAACLRTTAQVA